MLEIFIPQKIKNYWSINNISDNFLKIIHKSFNDLNIEKFESAFFEWIKIKSNIFNKNLIILCNWEFWENYFMDYDYIENNFETLGIQIIWENKISNKINEIMLNIYEITLQLNSNKLLTNTKKEEIKSKIDNSFFTLSWIIFLLYSLKKETENNLKELRQVKWKVEYEWQAMLLSETSITKNIELKAAIDKLEIKIELFIDTIKSLIK